MKLVITLLISMSFLCSQAQITDRAKNKAENKANNRVDNKIDKGLDEGLNAIEGLFKKKDKKKKNEKSSSKEDVSPKTSNDNSGTEGFPIGLFGGSAEVKDNYQFHHSIDMNTTHKKGNGKVKDTFQHTMYLNDKEPLFGMTANTGEGSGQFIFDMEKSEMIMMSESGGSKIGMVSSINKDLISDYQEEDNNLNFKKTGKFKTILGYTCDEWAGEDDDNTFSSWVARDSGMNLGKAFQTYMSSSEKKNQGNAAYPEGLMMEMNSKDKKNGEEIHMIVTSVNKNSNTSISTEGWEFMKLPGGR